MQSGNGYEGREDGGELACHGLYHMPAAAPSMRVPGRPVYKPQSAQGAQRSERTNKRITISWEASMARRRLFGGLFGRGSTRVDGSHGSDGLAAVSQRPDAGVTGDRRDPEDRYFPRSRSRISTTSAFSALSVVNALEPGDASPYGRPRRSSKLLSSLWR